MSASYNWDPITVDIVVTATSLLYDQAVAAWAAAGDTVIIEGAVVAEGAAGRGIFRILGLAGLLLSMDGGGPMGTRIHEPTISWNYTWPDNREQNGTLIGVTVNGMFYVTGFRSNITPTVTLDAGTGVCSLVDPVMLSVGITGLDPGMNGFGTVTFYVGEYVRTVDVCAWQSQGGPWLYGAAIPVTGEDIGGPPTGSYTATAVYNGAICSTNVYNSASSNSCTVGVN